MVKDVKSFCEFENENDLFSRTYLGEPYWQYVRFAVCEGIFSPSLEIKEKIKESKSKLIILKEAITGFRYAIKSLQKLNRIKEHEVICFKSTIGHDRFYDYWKMPDEIDDIAIRCNNDIRDINKDDLNILAPYFRANIEYLIKKKMGFLKVDDDEKRFIESVVHKLESKYHKCPSASYIEDLILRYLFYRKYYLPFWNMLFDRVKCKAIIVVWYYQVPMMIAYEIAKKKGIQIIELQHGVINNHEEYWFEDLRGKNNYTPDYFLAFGSQHIAWTKMLKSTLCLPVGYPYQEYMIKQFGNINTDDMMIVIYPETNAEFETVVDEFVNKAVKKGYKVLMKLHPLQTENYEVYFPILSKNNNIKVIKDQSKGIYYWLKIGKYHIMANSTVGYEALAFEHTKIYISLCANHEQMQPLLDWSIASGFNTSSELLNMIESYSKSEKEIDRTQIWDSNSSENIKNYMANMHIRNWPDVNHYNHT